MADSETTQNTTTAGGATDSSSDVSSNAGAEALQPTNANVDNGIVEAKGNSDSSDESNGAEGSDGVRQRPSRAERRISELTTRIKELEGALQQPSTLTQELSNNQVSPSSVQLPDYSQMSEITPDQIKQDIINAASQIVDLKMQTTAKVLESNFTRQQSADKRAVEIEKAEQKYSVLNPNSEDYDEDLVHDITESYGDVYAKDPTYSFTKFLQPLTRVLDSMSNTTGKPSNNQEVSSKGKAANKPTSSPAKSQKPFESMTSKEMEQYFASKRVR